MPKSRGRTRAVYTPPPRAGKAKVSPRWLVPTMLGCLVVGLAWIALFYITSQNLPLPALGPQGAISRALADRELADAVLEQGIQSALALLLDAEHQN